MGGALFNGRSGLFLFGGLPDFEWKAGLSTALVDNPVSKVGKNTDGLLWGGAGVAWVKNKPLIGIFFISVCCVLFLCVCFRVFS